MSHAIRGVLPGMVPDTRIAIATIVLQQMKRTKWEAVGVTSSTVTLKGKCTCPAVN